jgi:hypothetical protein
MEPSTKSRIVSAVVILALVSGCSDSSAPKQDLEAHLALSIIKYGSFLPLTVEFVLDPTGTTSGVTSVDSLKVRWDLDGDGSWDSDFGALGVYTGDLPAVPYGNWSARCEVLDQSGNTSIAEDSIPLPEWMPLAPDLVVGDLIVNNNSVWEMTDMDTLAVDTEFRVQLPARIWADIDHVVMAQVNYYIDDTLESQVECRLLGPFSQFGNIICPSAGLTILEPGTHFIEAVVILPDGVEDSDNSNNQRAGTRVFVSTTN